MEIPDKDSFYLNTKKHGPCIEWLGPFNNFGRATHEGKAAARFAWAIRNGSFPPPGSDVCHTCDNPKCVDAYHLFLGSPLDNARDSVAKSRRRKKKPVADRSWLSKWLSDNGFNQRQFADSIGVCYLSVWFWINREKTPFLSTRATIESRHPNFPKDLW